MKTILNLFVALFVALSIAHGIAVAQPPNAAIRPASFDAPPIGGERTYALSDFEGMAQTNNPVLARGAARVAAARGQWLQVGLPANPTAGYSGSELGQEGTAGQQGGFVSQQISTGGKLTLNRAVACQEIRAADFQLQAARCRVSTDVRIAFYQALAAQRKVEITQELVEVGQRAFVTVDKFRQAKEASRVDLLQSRVEANLARVLLTNAQNDSIAAWRRLAAVVGVPEMCRVPLSGNLEAPAAEIVFEEAMQRLLSSSPELAAIQTNICRSQQAVARARAEWIPNLDLQAGVQHDNATHYDIANVQISLPIPILNRNQGGIDRAEAELMAAQADARRAELDLRQRLASSYQRYANARQQVANYRGDILPDVKTALDLVSNGYRKGEIGYSVMLTAQRTYFQTNLAYLDSVVQLRESSELIDGLLLSESLRAEEVSR